VILLHRPVATFAIHNPPKESSFMAVFKAYLDDSGDDVDPQHSACSMGGFLGTFEAWAAFECEWQRLLSELNIPWLHMKEFAHYQKPFDHLDDADRVRVLKALIKTIKECELTAFGVTIRVPDLRRFNAERNRNLEALPLALYVCMNDIYVEDPWRKVQIILDKFDKPYNAIKKAKAYAAGHWSDDVSRNTEFLALKQTKSYKNILPMQAADFIAYEIKKNVESRRDWFDSTVGDDPDTWEETERRWLASKELPRKSLKGLLETIRAQVTIWDYRILCHLDDKRSGRWSSWR
jgi:hypothetical protein